MEDYGGGGSKKAGEGLCGSHLQKSKIVSSLIYHSYIYIYYKTYTTYVGMYYVCYYMYYKKLTKDWVISHFLSVRQYSG